jgi:hypothetical protein
MEYNAKFEMIDTQAKAIAEKVYAEALKLRDPRHLYEVKHNKRDKKYREIPNSHWQEYDDFDEAMNSGDYNRARDKIKLIFTKLDGLYNGKSNFSEVLKGLDEIKDNVAL